MTPPPRGSKGVPGAVSAFEQDPIRETKVYGPRLPPAILNETPRLQERADFLRSIEPKNTNRPSEDGIHHTETSVRERSNFGERGKIFGSRDAKVLQESDGFRQRVALARQRARTRRDRSSDRRERSAGPARRATRASPPPAAGRPLSVPPRARRDRRETSWTASRARSTEDSGAARPAARDRASRGCDARQGSSVFRISSVRARSLPAMSKRWRTKSEPPRNRSSPPPARTTRAAAATARTIARGLLFLGRTRPRRRKRGSLSTTAPPDRPRPGARRRPRPWSRAGLRASGAAPALR